MWLNSNESSCEYNHNQSNFSKKSIGKQLLNLETSGEKEDLIKKLYQELISAKAKTDEYQVTYNEAVGEIDALQNHYENVVNEVK